MNLFSSVRYHFFRSISLSNSYILNSHQIDKCIITTCTQPATHDSFNSTFIVPLITCTLEFSDSFHFTSHGSHKLCRLISKITLQTHQLHTYLEKRRSLSGFSFNLWKNVGKRIENQFYYKPRNDFTDSLVNFMCNKYN